MTDVAPIPYFSHVFSCIQMWKPLWLSLTAPAITVLCVDPGLGPGVLTIMWFYPASMAMSEWLRALTLDKKQGHDAILDVTSPEELVPCRHARLCACTYTKSLTMLAFAADAKQ